MHPPAPKSRRDRRLPLLALAIAASLGAAGCENVPPHLQRNYLRVGAPALYERAQSEEDRGTGPYPGLSTTLGTMLEVQNTRATALEIEAEGFWLDPNSQFDGWGLKILAGPRWFWELDRRWRPNVGVGALWTQFFLEDHHQEDEPRGAGAYGDVGIDWMVTPFHAIGVRLRGSFHYEEADHENGIKPAVELALQSMWRF